MPDRNNTNGIRRLENSITAVREMISKSYMEQFTENDCQVLRVNDRDRVQTGIRLLKIDQIALSDELMESRLTSIYQTLKQLVNSCFMIIQGTGEEVSVYLGFQADAAGTAEGALTQTLIGNFPGIVFESMGAGKINGGGCVGCAIPQGGAGGNGQCTGPGEIYRFHAGERIYGSDYGVALR